MKQLKARDELANGRTWDELEQDAKKAIFATPPVQAERKAINP